MDWGLTGVTLFSGRFGFLAGRGRIGRPEVPAAAQTNPELIGRPWLARRRVSKLHLIATALAPDVNVDAGHTGILHQLAVLRFPSVSTRRTKFRVPHEVGLCADAEKLMKQSAVTDVRAA